MTPKTFTLDQLAAALRGMPRDAPMLVRLQDGAFRGIRRIRPMHVAADGNEVLQGGSDGTLYAITLAELKQ